MKSIIIILVTFLSHQCLQAQSVDYKKDLNNQSSITIETEYPAVEVRFYDGSELKITGIINSNGVIVKDVLEFDWKDDGQTALCRCWVW